jgi:hypothetical protein
LPGKKAWVSSFSAITLPRASTVAGPGRTPAGPEEVDVTVRIAVLDDYQGVALRHGPWTDVTGAEVTPFREHLLDPGELVRRLQGFDVLVAMR